jgi:hypothetical protein
MIEKIPGRPISKLRVIHLLEAELQPAFEDSPADDGTLVPAIVFGVPADVD